MNKNQNVAILKIISKLTLIVWAHFFSINLLAQNDTIVPVDENPEELLKDLNLNEYRQKGFNIWNDDFNGHWAGFDFGINILVNEDYSGYDTPFLKNDILRSNSAYINLIQKNFGLQRNRNTIGLLTGIGLHLQSYRLDNNTSLERRSDGTIAPLNLVSEQNQKSKFSLVSLTLPLLTEFQIPVNHYNNRIYISGGMYGGLRLGSHTKIKYRSEGKKEKLKTPGHFSLQDFKYGVMMRTGYRWINIFATYELEPLFKEEKGPHLAPVTVGITLIKL